MALGMVATSLKQRRIQLPPLERVENKQSLSKNKFADAYIFSGEKGKRDSIIVVAQLCPEFKARLVDRWQELEAKVATYAIGCVGCDCWN